MTRDKETVGDFMEHWLITYVRTNTSLRTEQGYRANVNRYIVQSHLTQGSDHQADNLDVGTDRVTAKDFSTNLQWGSI